MISRNPFYAIAILATIVSVLVTASAQASSKTIFEKNSVRYFRLGEQEYKCQNNNQISEEDALDIERRIKLIHGKDKPTRQDLRILDTVWGELHKVYRGDAYSNILFVALRFKLNGAFGVFRKVPDRDSVVSKALKWHLTHGNYDFHYDPDGARVNRMSRSLCGGLVTLNIDYFGTIRRSHKMFYDMYYHYRIFAENPGGAYTVVETLEAYRGVKVKPISNYRGVILPKDPVKSVKGWVESLLKTQREKILARGASSFSEGINALLKYYSEHAPADANPVIEHGAWGLLLLKILQSSVDNPKQFGAEPADVKVLAQSVLNVIVKYTQNKRALKSIEAYVSRQKLTMPKAKKKRDKPF